MRSLSVVFLVCAAMLFVPQIAHTEASDGQEEAVKNYSLGELDSDKQRAMKLDNQIEILKKEIQLEELNSKRKGGGELPPKAIDEKPVDTAWVSSISGNNGRLHATIQFSDGSSVTVSEGDSLPQKGRVIKISRSGVIVQQKADIVIYAMSPAVRRSAASESSAPKRPELFDSTKGGI